MNATVHAQLSSKRRGGTPEEWYAIHDMMDWSKEVESSNAHRAFSHHMAFVKRVMVPVWGHTIHLTGGGTANLKDTLEQDHLLADFSDRYIPTVADYMSLVADDPTDADLIGQFDRENAAFYAAYPQVRELMLYPLEGDGTVKSLLLTHNSWFVQRILPRVFPAIKVEIRDFTISPARLANRIAFTDWVNNGRGAPPPSFAKIAAHRKRPTRAPRPVVRDEVLDGNRTAGAPSVVFDGGPRSVLAVGTGGYTLEPSTGPSMAVFRDGSPSMVRSSEEPFIDGAGSFYQTPPAAWDAAKVPDTTHYTVDGSRPSMGIRILTPEELAKRDINPEDYDTIADGHFSGTLVPKPEEPAPEGHEYVRDVDGVARGTRPVTPRKPDHLID